jgi:hypothetical protein
LAEPPAAPASESWGSASAHLSVAAAPDGVHSRVPAVRDEVRSVSPEVRDAERFRAVAAQGAGCLPDGACLPDAIHSRDEHFHAADSTRAQLAQGPVSSHGSQPGDSKFRDGSRLQDDSKSLVGLRSLGDSKSPDGSQSPDGSPSLAWSCRPAGLRSQDDSKSLAGLRLPDDSPFLCY